ncbi:MAG: hypothetical protein ABIS38_07710 [Sphingomicrobium sp.]
MLNLIAAALVAAAPAPPADAHAGHQMGDMKPGQMGEMKPDKMGEMKDGCACCKDMKAKMDGKHADHQSQGNQ